MQPAITTYYADFYNSLEDETPTDYGQITNDGTVARTETIDGQEIDLTACLITASEYPEIIGRTVYGNIDDMQYIGTDTKVPTYVEYEGAVVNYGYAIISREPIPHPTPESTITVVSQDTLDGQPYGDPVQLSSDSYDVGTNQVIDLGIIMLDGTYSNPTCSDETFVDWSFDPGNDENDPETDEDERYNATITITSVPNEDLTFSFEHSVD